MTEDMKSALSMQSILDLNNRKHPRQTVPLPQAKGFVCVTTNFEIGSTNLLHYHEKPHLSFILNGGSIDKRKNSETERLSGELVFFHAGEPHQTIYKLFPATNK